MSNEIVRMDGLCMYGEERWRREEKKWKHDLRMGINRGIRKSIGELEDEG